MSNKNFLLFSIDDMRSPDSWGHFASLVSTPNVAALMAQGTTFSRAISQAPLCNPSRASFLSGQQPTETGVLDNATPWFERIDPAATLPGVLKAAGVHVAMFGKHFHDEGLSEARRAAMFDEYFAGSDKGGGEIADDETRHQTPFPAGRYLGPEENLRDAAVVDAAVRFLEKRAPDLSEPFFLGVGIYKPHLNWFVPPEYFDRYDRGEIRAALELSLADGSFIPGEAEYFDVPEMSRPSPEHAAIAANLDQWVDYLHAYLAALSYADARVGEVLDALAADPALAADTTILLWSDHGYQLGDKDRWGKFAHWRESTEVPLIVVDPDLPGGRTADQIVSLVDVYPTILELMGVARPAGLPLSGESLLPLLNDPDAAWRDPETGRGVALTAIYGSFSVRTDVTGVGDVRYTRYPDGTEELYKLGPDPLEHVNRLDPRTGAGLTAADDLLAAEMRAELDATLARAGVLVSDRSGPTIGGPADETLVATIGAGVNELRGGGGDDTYVLHADAIITEEADGGRDAVIILDRALEAGYRLPTNVEMAVVASSLVGNAADNWITSQHDGELEGRGGDDVLNGGSGDHTLRGGSGDDVLRGGGGSDRLSGGDGADDLDGGIGRDLLLGGPNADRLRGNAGDDVFDFNKVGHSRPETPDVILDFEGAGAPGGDLVDLSDIDANVLAPGRQAFSFGESGLGGLWLAPAAGGAEALADVDGDGKADLRLLIAGVDPLQFVRSDFAL